MGLFSKKFVSEESDVDEQETSPSQDSSEKKVSKVDIVSKYIPTQGGLSYKQLNLGAWYLRNKFLFQKIGIGMLIGFCVITIGYSGFRWIEYIIFGYWDDLDMSIGQVEEISNYTVKQNRYGAQNIQFKRPEVFSGSSEKYDFSADALNPNNNWVAQIKYKFVYSAGETELQEALVLPGSESPLVVLGHESRSFPAQARIEIIEMNWRRINPHWIPDVAGYVNSRLLFNIDEFVFTRASRTELPSSQLEFKITNQSAYSYWQPIFYVLLYENSRLVGIRKLALDQFRAGEEREIDLRLIDTSINITSIKVVPTMNVFDEGEFMKPGE